MIKQKSERWQCSPAPKMWQRFSTLPHPASCLPPTGREGLRGEGSIYSTDPRPPKSQHPQVPTWRNAVKHSPISWLFSHLSRQPCFVSWPQVCPITGQTSKDGHGRRSIHSESTFLKNPSLIPIIRPYPSLPRPTQALHMSLSRGPKDWLHIISDGTNFANCKLLQDRSHAPVPLKGTVVCCKPRRALLLPLPF